MRVSISRDRQDEEGTFGILTMSLGKATFTCVTGELPWKNNASNSSCIPPGIYKAKMGNSSLGRRFRLSGVPGREGILIHAGNFCGDRSFGHRSDTEGCILLGTDFGVLEGQKAITNSRFALAVFEEFARGKELEVEIR